MSASPAEEEHSVFAAASAPVRLNVLRLLASKGPMAYTEIMASLRLDPVKDAGKFAYHLRTLIEALLIAQDKDTKKYSITELGSMLVNFAREVQEYINVKRGRLYVRTSRFAIEEFDRSKIARSLITEAGVPLELAEKIAGEAEDRLVSLKITYLTAPLIREFVNALLIEKRLEEYRHKLTRLGMPVYDVTMMLGRLGERRLQSGMAQRTAGSAVMAEYVLLNGLPLDIADAHLSGLIHLEDLDSWILKINEVQHDVRSFLKLGLPTVGPPGSLEAALTLLQLVYRLAAMEVSGEQSIDLFNIFLAPYAHGRTYDEIKRALTNFMFSFRDDSVSNSISGGLTLACELRVPRFLEGSKAIGPDGKETGLYGDYRDEAFSILDALVEAAFEASRAKPIFNPHLIFKIREDVLKEAWFEEILLKIHRLALERSFPQIVYLKEDSKDTYSATGLRLTDEWSLDWTADCMNTGCAGAAFINMPRIAYESGGNEEALLDKLRDAMSLLLRAFKVKREALEQRLRQRLIPLLSGRGKAGYYVHKNSAYLISLLGLNEAMAIIFGEPIRQNNPSLRFAERIVSGLNGWLRDWSQELGLRLLLAERSSLDGAARLAGLDLERYGRSSIAEQVAKGYSCYTDMPTVPLTLPLGLEERLLLGGRFHGLLKGGHHQPIVLTPVSESYEAALKATKLAIRYGIRSLSYVRNQSYCYNCDETQHGLLSKCPTCGSTELMQISAPSSSLYPLDLWPEAARRSLNARVEYSLSLIA